MTATNENTAAAATETRGRRPGRPGMLENKQKIYQNLVKIRDNDDGAPSRYIALKLVDAGYLTVTDGKSEGPGRPPKVYKLTRKATDLIRRENKKMMEEEAEEDDAQTVTEQDEETVVSEDTVEA